MTINKLTMKRVLLSILFCAFISISLSARSPRERVFISTDKDVYVAGEKVWISGFCFKLDNGEMALSDISSLLYIEIYADAKPVSAIKMGLENGRGSAWADLPLNLATGNYKIIAYTSYMRNEKPIPYFEKSISIYNTLSTERLPGVKIESLEAISKADNYSVAIANNEHIEIQLPLQGKLSKETDFEWSISNKLNKNISASISIYRKDSIPIYNNMRIDNFIKGGIKAIDGDFSGDYIPEYEGEIIKGRVTPANGGDVSKLSGNDVFISFPGGDGEFYTSITNENGEVLFFTNNFYGDRECVLEVVPRDTSSKFIVELFDPFIHPEVNPSSQLTLFPSLATHLEERSMSMQLMKRFGADTLFQTKLPLHNPLFGSKKRVYRLDDYTRFPVMEEVLIEYVAELRYRKNENNAQILVRWDKDLNTVEYSREHTLVLLDGVPVFNHSKILEYDPLKVESLSIYGSRFYTGHLSFTGIASFKTYSGNYQGLTFDKSVRIVDIEGAKPISRLTGEEFKDGQYPDFRHTLLWEPLSTISALGISKFYLKTPSVTGQYVVVLQGVTDGGEPVYFEQEFSVE